MIQRDGHCKSLWQTDALSYRPVNRLNRQRSYDVVIVGGGITGVSTALLLQQAGKSCLLLEANTLCFGTTGGTRPI
jgi:glycerol-3-phosphate dehydrogenase